MALLRAFFVALLPSASDAIFKTTCKTFAFAAMDPIVSPKARSSHEHSIGGSLGFDVETNAAKMIYNRSTCDIVGDHSNYWFPSMFRTDSGAKLRLKPIIIAYYEMFSAEEALIDPTLVGKIPIDMVVGHSTGDPTMANIEIYCRNKDGALIKSPERGWHPTMPGCYQVRIDFTFPSCWNGKHYAADQSHVAYPIGYPDKNEAPSECPLSHPKKFMQLRLQQRYELGSNPARWSGGQAPFVFASGGITTAHADVSMLWDVPTLVHLLTTCRGPIESCKYTGIKLLSIDTQNAIAAKYVVPKAYLP
ncbi:unnamed protein product [Phaeothamnion confervicola]